MCGVEKLNSAEKGMVVSRCVYLVRHPRGSCIVYPIAVYGMWPHEETNQVIRRCRPCARNARLVIGSYSSRMKLTFHATRRTSQCASRLVQAMSAWSLKTRRAPNRRCRNARVYGRTTTAMHDTSASPPPSSLPFALNRQQGSQVLVAIG